MIETYIVTKKDKVVFSCESDSLENVLKSLEFMGIEDYDNIQTIPTTNHPRPNTYLDEYDENFVLKSDYERAKLGRLKLQDDQELDEDNKIIKRKENKPSDPFEEMDLEATKKWALETLSGMCVGTNFSMLSQHTRDNIYCGATEGYPDYLQGENGIQTIKHINNFFRNVYANNAAIIETLETKEEIKLFIENLEMPTEAQILQEVIN